MCFCKLYKVINMIFELFEEGNLRLCSGVSEGINKSGDNKI